MAFPADGLDSFGASVIDLQDKVMANHVNSLRAAVVSIETAIGTSVLSSAWDATAPTTSSTWTTVTDRLVNLERAAKNGFTTGAPYFKVSGDTVTAVSKVAITAKGDGTNNIISTKTSGDVLGFYVDKDGFPKVNVSGSGKEVLYVGSTSYQSILNTLSDLNANILGNAPINLLMLSGM